MGPGAGGWHLRRLGEGCRKRSPWGTSLGLRGAGMPCRSAIPPQQLSQKGLLLTHRITVYRGRICPPGADRCRRERQASSLNCESSMRCCRRSRNASPIMIRLKPWSLKAKRKHERASAKQGSKSRAESPASGAPQAFPSETTVVYAPRFSERIDFRTPRPASPA